MPVVIGVLLSVLYGQFLSSGAVPVALLAESGVQSSLIHVQDAAQRSGKLDAVVVGSSLTARMHESFLSESGFEVATVGLDGQGPTTGLDVVVATDIDVPVVLIEANFLERVRGDNASTLLDAIDGPIGQLNSVFPALRAESRPSSILYSQLKTRRDGGLGTSDPDVAPQVAATCLRFDSAHTTVLAPELDPVLSEQLQDLQGEGRSVVFYFLPDNGRMTDDQQAVAEAYAARFDIPILDLRSAELELTYTDGLHLNVASARSVAHVLARSALPVESLCS